MLLDQLRLMNTRLNSIAAQVGASRLWVFVSSARGEQTADSEADFLVEFPRGYDLFTQCLPLAQGQADLLHRKVDLLPEYECPHLRDHVLAEAVSS
jgi:predicted nucleotidyltransferase